MLSAVLQPEIDTLQSQIAQLQATIAAAQERITHLNEVESIATGAIQTLQTALQKVSALTPDAIASLKSAVLELFTGDTSNQPIDSSLEQIQEPELNGQYSDFASLLSDAPVVDDPFIELIQVSARVSYQRRHDGEIICTYAGSNNKAKLRLWGEWLAVHRTVASGFEIREAKRLTNFKHELKLWGMSLDQISQLAECDFTKDPTSESNPFKDAPKPPLQKVAPVNQPAPTEAELEALEREALASIQPIETAVSAVSGYSANPIGRRGADANWKAFQASGRKLDLNLGFDSMEKWRKIEAEQNALVAVSEPDF
jgi:hypothetical protein